MQWLLQIILLWIFLICETLGTFWGHLLDFYLPDAVLAADPVTRYMVFEAKHLKDLEYAHLYMTVCAFSPKPLSSKYSFRLLKNIQIQYIL